MARRVGRLKSKNILGFAHLKASLHVESMWHVPFVVLFFCFFQFLFCLHLKRSLGSYNKTASAVFILLYHIHYMW